MAKDSKSWTPIGLETERMGQEKREPLVRGSLFFDSAEIYLLGCGVYRR
jgi:hypothetical protein